MSLLRKAKAVIASAVTWAIGWGSLTVAIGALAFWLSDITLAKQLPALFWPILIVRQMIGGAINGVVFAVALMLIGRRRTFATLTLPHVAACGAIGGLIFPLISYSMIYTMLPAAARASISAQVLMGLSVGATIGAAIGAGALLVARRAPQLSASDATPTLNAPSTRVSLRIDPGV